MESYYKVSVTFDGDKSSNVDFLVSATSEKDAFCKTTEYFANNPIKIDIGKAKLTTISRFLGSWDSSWFYTVKIKFICTGLEVCKERTLAVGADTLIDAINIVDQAMEDIHTIKHFLLSERQLKSLEYHKPIDYIDYIIEGLMRSNIELLN